MTFPTDNHDWFTYFDGTTNVTIFVQADSEKHAQGILLPLIDEKELRYEDDGLPTVSQAHTYHDHVPGPGEARVIDLHHADVAANRRVAKPKGGHGAHVIPQRGEPYDAWPTVEYVNEALYDGTHGFGVWVWEDSVTNPEPVNALGRDKTNRRFPVPVGGVSRPGPFGERRAKVQPLGDGFSVNVDKGTYAVWFPTKDSADKFRASVHNWQRKRPKFKITDHVGG